MNHLRPVKIIGQRPTHTPTGVEIPAGWLIGNAPRPLDGDLTWAGNPFRGAFYAAIDPAGPEADRYRRTGSEADAVTLEYVDEAAAVAEALTLYLADFPEETGEIEPHDRFHRRALLDFWGERQRG